MPKRKPRTIYATGWGATTLQLAHDRDAQLLADGLLRLIEEAKNPPTRNVID